jgi:hypothetical protein
MIGVAIPAIFLANRIGIKNYQLNADWIRQQSELSHSFQAILKEAVDKGSLIVPTETGNLMIIPQH